MKALATAGTMGIAPAHSLSMPPLCCISIGKTRMNNNNRPSAPMAGPVGPAVKPSHFPRRASTRNPKPATRHGKNVGKTYFYTLGLWLWPAMVAMMALFAPGAPPPILGLASLAVGPQAKINVSGDRTLCAYALKPRIFSLLTTDSLTFPVLVIIRSRQMLGSPPTSPQGSHVAICPETQRCVALWLVWNSNCKHWWCPVQGYRSCTGRVARFTLYTSLDKGCIEAML